MAISRAQLSEQIDALSNGGTPTATAPEADPTIADQYVSGLKSIDRSPVAYKDVADGFLPSTQAHEPV
jgi:hypothetical protein